MVRKRNRGKRKVVDFFAGIKTPSKKDDRRVRFIAREKRKNVFAPPKELSEGIQTKGLLEMGGSKFDRNFGIGKDNIFSKKIGIDPNFGKGSFDVDFSSEFTRGDFINQPSAIDPVDDDSFDDLDMEEQFQQETDDEVPRLLDSIPKINQGRKLEDRDEFGRTKEQRIQKKFLRVRQEALETGGNPLTPEEENQFSVVRPTRNFGTTGKTARGVGLGRF